MKRIKQIKKRRGGLLLVVGLLFGGAWGHAALADEGPAGTDFFEKKVRPVLADRCYACHSATAKKVRGGLRMDTRGDLLRGGESGPALVPGEPDQSLLVKAIRYTDPVLRMPPKQRLSPQEVADIEAWVKAGAPMPRTSAVRGPAQGPDKRWALQPPKAQPLPDIRRKDWAVGPIDCFILARLEAKGLQSAPAADKCTLLRRVTSDLIGLPPTPQEVGSFLKDQSPEAFAAVVDRLLKSPRYGERWGRHWLDLVRYTDDFDEAWRYRDWVVSAFNQDLPYDQFIRDQIAGDLLPAKQPGAVNADGIVATTLLTIGPWGGIDRKKRLADIVDDQIDTIGRTFLGLTLACARCHDHKFDPIPAADYYGLAGIFYSTRILSDSAYLSHGTHRLRVPLVPPADVEKHQRHMARIAEVEEQLADLGERGHAAIAATLLPQTDKYLLAVWDFRHRPADQAGVSLEDWAKQRDLQPFALQGWINYLGNNRLGESHLLAHPVRNYDGEMGVHVWGAHAERPWWGVNTTDHDVPIETFLLPPHSVSVNPGTAGGAVVWKSPVTGRVRITGRLTDADPHDGNGVIWVVDHAGGGMRRELSSGTLPNGASKTLAQGKYLERLASVPVKAGDELSLGVLLRTGDAHYDITNIELTITRLDGPGEWDLKHEAEGSFLAGNPHGVWAFYDMAESHRWTRMPAVDLALKGWDKAVADKADRVVLRKVARELQQAIEKGGPEGPLAQALTGVGGLYRADDRDDTKSLSAAGQAEVARLSAELQRLKASVPPLPCAHGAQEGGLRYGLFPGIQDARIHVRGSYSRLGDRVPRRFPRSLAGGAQPPITAGSGRRELADWIASPKNPVTARVMVNRIWQHHFGEGIVRTPSNFGAMGTPPTHPELLDYLAQQFIVSGWSVKAMHRMILLSATYQQSSKVTGESLRLDPNNLLCGRMNRRQVEAEALRDSLLAVCGCLDMRPGGPAEGDAQSHRRMLYLRIARSDKSGLAAVFDGADASIQVEKRTTSTVAPQALLLMNSPLVVEKVGRLVQRPEVANLKKPEERIQALYGLLFGRRASVEEEKIGCRFIEAMTAMPAPAKAGDATPLGPWEAYAQALLMSNEFLFVD
jgi:hypothetical protein